MADNGLASFRRRLNAIPENIKAEIRGDLVRAAEEVADAVRTFAPKDSGELANSVAVTGPGGTTPAHSQPGGSMVVPDNSAAITVGNNDVRYAHLVEFGTIKAAAQPFFFPAWNMSRKQAVKTIGAAVRRAVRGQA